MKGDPNVSEDRARLIWRRAAELQAEAARKLEERSRALAPGEEDGSDFLLTDVKTAAIEAGISPEFVELALAESNADTGSPSHEKSERRARRFLGSHQTNIEASRVIKASPAAVLDALQRVLPSPRFALLHVDTLGDDPLDDGVYVFEPPSMWTQAGTAAEFAQQMGSISAKRIYVSMRAIGERQTQVAIRAPVARGLRINYRVGAGLVAGVAAGGAFGAGAVAASVLGGALAAPAFIPAVALGALAGASGIGGFSFWGVRAGYRHGLRKAEKALETLVQVVDASARSRGGFSMPAVEPPPANPFG